MSLKDDYDYEGVHRGDWKVRTVMMMMMIDDEDDGDDDGCDWKVRTVSI